MARQEIALIAVDVGSSYMKCAVMLHTVGNAGYYTKYSASLPLYVKEGSDPDVQGWFLLLLYWLKNLDSLTLQTIEAMVICGQGPSLVGVDISGSIVKPVLLRDLLHETSYGVRNREVGSYFIPMAFWYKQHYPLHYKKVVHFLPIPEYMAFRLSGTACAMYPNQRYREYYWDKNNIKGAGLDIEKFPRLVPIGGKIGILSKEIAHFANLKSGIALYSGGLDFAMALIGTNTLRSGRVCDCAGYSQGINYCSEEPLEHSLVYPIPHIIKHHWNNALIIESIGVIYEKVIQHVTLEKQGVYKFIAAEKRNELYIPRLFHTGHIDLFSNDQQLDITSNEGLTSTVVSLLFIQRFFLEEVQRISGIPIHEVRLCGGQSYYDLWNQIKCNFTGIEYIRMENHNSELVGCAICALYGLGIYSSIAKAAGYIDKPKVRYYPDPDHFIQTEEYYQEFSEQFTKYLTARSSRL